MTPTVDVVEANLVTRFPARVAGTETSLPALVKQSLLLAQRLLTVWSRDPLTMVQAVLYPALMLAIMRIVLGDSVTQFNSLTLISGVNYAKPDSIYGTTPLMMLVAAMVGSIAGAVLVHQERRQGFLSRLYVMPIHRSADIVGRVIAEVVRIILTTFLIAAVGVACGFRFNQGFLPSVALLFIPILFGAAFFMFTLTLALASARTTLVEIASLAVTLLMFFNSGFVPASGYPAWAQPIVSNQPMTHAIEAMRALAIGGDVAGPLVSATLWSGAFILVFMYPAVRFYRKSATGELSG